MSNVSDQNRDKVPISKKIEDLDHLTQAGTDSREGPLCHLIMKVDKLEPVVLFELVKGMVTGTPPNIGNSGRDRWGSTHARA